MIEAEGLTKKFVGTTAVESLTLHLEEGEIFGPLGPNGAGKTPTVRMLATLISRTSGSAVVAGCRLGNEADELRLRQRIGSSPRTSGSTKATAPTGTSSTSDACSASTPKP